MQFYTGNFLGRPRRHQRQDYRQTDGFTLETQHFPDSPNQPSFPSTTLGAGHTFNVETIYKFGATEHGKFRTLEHNRRH